MKQQHVVPMSPGGACFRKRWLLTIPPENVGAGGMEAVGLHPGIHYHNHSPGLAVLPNGDLLATFFSSPKHSREDATDATMIAARLRYGAEEWDLADMIYDIPDANDQSAPMWVDSGTVHFFWGGRDPDGIIFRWVQSKDNGATWTPIRMVAATPPFGKYAEQPVTSAFRGPDRTIYVATTARAVPLCCGRAATKARRGATRADAAPDATPPTCVLKNGCILGHGRQEHRH